MTRVTSFSLYVYFWKISLLVLDTFQMGKIHKDIAMFMVDAAKNEEYSDQRLVKVITQRLFQTCTSLLETCVRKIRC